MTASPPYLTRTPERPTPKIETGRTAVTTSLTLPVWAPPLSQALSRLRLRGAIFLRAEYSEGWAYESLATGDLSAILVAGAQGVTLFHVVGGGRCWVQVEDGERHGAEAGDVIAPPYGDPHRMGGTADAAI